MEIYNYHKEKKEKRSSSLYFKAFLFAIFLAVVFLGGLKLIKFLLGMIIRHWIWAIVILVAVFLVRHYIRKRRMMRLQQ